ncbi:unnamed protein product [Pleuronectes platessa]|uniref:Uncharacterized protein n=1 Tax=Pleuronectes platessa TaxID=8262 RepID=A0A9N7U4X5_PLEPL|nr:unnamed protein product [Pleuronectes platessa]
MSVHEAQQEEPAAGNQLLLLIALSDVDWKPSVHLDLLTTRHQLAVHSQRCNILSKTKSSGLPPGGWLLLTASDLISARWRRPNERYLGTEVDPELPSGLGRNQEEEPHVTRKWEVLMNLPTSDRWRKTDEYI